MEQDPRVCGRSNSIDSEDIGSRGLSVVEPTAKEHEVRLVFAVTRIVIVRFLRAGKFVLAPNVRSKKRCASSSITPRRHVSRPNSCRRLRVFVLELRLC